MFGYITPMSEEKYKGWKKCADDQRIVASVPYVPYVFEYKCKKQYEAYRATCRTTFIQTTSEPVKLSNKKTK